jgi:hypothetical protein
MDPAPAPQSDRSTADLDWRIGQFADEINLWVADTRTATNGLGLYNTRLTALHEMFQTLIQDKLRNPHTQLVKSVGQDGYSTQYRKLHESLRALHDVWGVFRSGFLLRQQPRYCVAIDTANLVVAECFSDALDRADKLRPGEKPPPRPAPPLVHLMPVEFPGAVFRNWPAQTIGVRLLAGQKVPLPIVTLPTDQLRCAWWLSFLYHEVGHLIDRELGVRTCLLTAIKSLSLPDERGTRWEPWVEEVTADVFGVLYGGPGYGLMLAELLGAVGPALAPESQYPPYWLRVRLVAELVRQHGGGTWDSQAKRIEELARPIPAGDSLRESVDDLRRIVEAALAATRIGSKGPVRNLGPPPGEHWAQVQKLATFLMTGCKRPGKPQEFPCRLVPMSAALAVAGAKQPDLKGIHERAIEFAAQTDRPTFLSVASGQTKYYREVAARMTLDPPAESA